MSPSTISLLLSKREGTTSVANIELLISSAIITSIPSLLVLFAILLPICGRATINISNVNISSAKTNFTNFLLGLAIGDN